MSTNDVLIARSQNKCELCGAAENLSEFDVPDSLGQSDAQIWACDTCQSQIKGETEIEPNHWRGLSDAMWAPIPAVQVLAWRMLTQLRLESWAQNLLDMLYLEDHLLEWAKAGEQSDNNDSEPSHKDCNGVTLSSGDTVNIIKDLDVKGSSITAKRGTAVRNISLTSNPEHIEGRVDGQRIVILTKFVKKST